MQGAHPAPLAGASARSVGQAAARPRGVTVTGLATRNPECWPDAARTVPAFLRYVSGLSGCGLIAWALIPGVLVTDQQTWAPTQILADYACDGSVSGQGAGELIQSLFATWAGQPAG